MALFDRACYTISCRAEVLTYDQSSAGRHPFRRPALVSSRLVSSSYSVSTSDCVGVGGVYNRLCDAVSDSHDEKRIQGDGGGR